MPPLWVSFPKRICVSAAAGALHNPAPTCTPNRPRLGSLMKQNPDPREMPDGTAPAAPSLQAHHRLSVRGQAGALHLNVQAGLTAPWTVLFGPSGCGKSTVLRALCGLTDLAVSFTRYSASDGSGTSLENTPPERRQLAYAPQQAALFPHLTVRENIAFATAVRRRSNPQTVPLEEILALLQLDPLAGRKPHHLSGGERQRVALARALAVPDARLLLLDEPFAGVDRALRDDLLPRIRAWLAHRNLPALSVTHDVDEALLLQADVLRLHEGRSLAQGPAPHILAPEMQRLLATLHPHTIPASSRE
jgi:molybdate transport system ATP-binding protein